MADFEKAIKIILKHEGGLVDHPNDPGGLTNRGITFNTFVKIAKSIKLEPTREALKALTEAQAKSIYKILFWNRMNGDLFQDQSVATIVMDFFVNSGVIALKTLQVKIGASHDGVIGPETLQILHQQNQKIVFLNYKDARVDFYRRLVERKPEMKVFINGWMNRINSFTYEI